MDTQTSHHPLTVYDEGSLLVYDAWSIDFVGAGVTGTASGLHVTETISGAPGGGTYAYDEIPSGAINDVNATFTLAFTPSPAGSLILELNGITQQLTTDYTMAGATITMTIAPQTGSSLVAKQYLH